MNNIPLPSELSSLLNEFPSAKETADFLAASDYFELGEMTDFLYRQIYEEMFGEDIPTFQISPNLEGISMDELYKKCVLERRPYTDFVDFKREEGMIY